MLEDGTTKPASSFVAVLVTAICGMIPAAKPQELSNTVWACAKCSWCDAGMLKPLFIGFMSKLATAKAQECSNVLWAAATVGYHDD